MQTVFLRRIGPHNTLALYWEAVFGYFGVLGHTSLHLYSWDDAVYYIDCIVSQYWAPPLLRSIGKDCILYWVDALYYTDCILTLYWATPLLRSIGMLCWDVALYYTDCIPSLYWDTPLLRSLGWLCIWTLWCIIEAVLCHTTILLYSFPLCLNTLTLY